MCNGIPRRGNRRDAGFTLIELMVSAALFIIIIGFIYTLFTAVLRTTASQEAKVGMQDEARRATQRTMQLLRGARAITGVDINGANVNFGALNATAVQLTFIYPEDTDGDFTVSSLLEYTGNMTLGLDLNDANGDGRTTQQIILLDDNGNVLDIFSNRAVAANNDAAGWNAPNGGFVVRNDGNNMLTVTVVLRVVGVAGILPVTIRESRTFLRKNI